MNIIGKTPDGKFIVTLSTNELLTVRDDRSYGSHVYESLDYASLGEQLLERRRLLGLSQSAMAKRLGMSRNYLSQIERGTKRNISAKFRDAIADVLGATP